MPFLVKAKVQSSLVQLVEFDNAVDILIKVHTHAQYTVEILTLTASLQYLILCREREIQYFQLKLGRHLSVMWSHYICDELIRLDMYLFIKKCNFIVDVHR